MSVVLERPLRERVSLEAFVVNANPVVLDTSWLGAGYLGADGEDITWTEYADQLLSVNIIRGGRREGITVRNQPGMLTVALRDFEIDPFAPAFVAGQPVRFSAVDGDERHLLFTGTVRDITTEWLRTAGRRPIPVTTIVAVDAVVQHDATTRYGAMPPAGQETFAERITRLTSTAIAPIEIPDDADYPAYGGGDTMLGRTVYESSVSNHLTLACNTAGAMWWVDPAGVTRIQPRKYDEESAVTFSNWQTDGDTPWPAGTLFGLADLSDAGSNSQMNAVTIRVKGAEPDPDDPSKWRATETDEQSTVGPFGVVQFGRRPVVLETNYTEGDFDPFAHYWVDPYSYGWSNMLAGIRWNAQQNLDKIPALDIGASIYAPRGGTYAGPWPKYIVIGLTHTITATRWLVTLTLIGAY